MYINLSGLRILVVGASNGLGNAVAKKLAEAGASLSMHCHKKRAKTEELAYALGNNSRAYEADFLDKKASADLFERVISDYGNLDALIYNTGTFSPSSLASSTDEWERQLEQHLLINFYALTTLSQLAYSHWCAKKQPGRIVNILLNSTRESQSPVDSLAYLTSKCASREFIRNFATAVYPDDVRAFNLLPPTLVPSATRPLGRSPHPVSATTPASRTRPQDIAPLVAFLCSGMADHATGTTIDMSHATAHQELVGGAASEAT